MSPEDHGSVSAHLSHAESTESTIEDEARHLHIPQKIHYSKSQVTIYRITSSICSFIFLSILMTFAITKSIVMKILHPVESNDSNLPSLPNEEKKLAPRLSYYFELHGLNLLEYKITTNDGFVLSLQRIIDPHESEESLANRKPILLLHGLLQSSGAYCTSGPDNSLAFFFHKQGYDVWLGNNRCGFEPQHAFLDVNDPNMWNWNIYNMARYDLPAMVDQIMSRSKSGLKITLVAHSQGTTQTFLALLSKNNPIFNSQLCEKLDCFIGLSPAVFGGSLLKTKLFIRFMNMLPKSMFNYVFGILSFMPIMMQMRERLYKTKLFGYLSYVMFNFLFDWDDSLWDNRYRTRHFLFSPVYTSSKLMLWWLNNEDGFIKNYKTIFNFQEEWFDENTPPIYLFVPGQDNLVDGELLIQHFQQYEKTIGNFQFKKLPTYSHLDVLWANDVIETIGKPIISFLNEIEDFN